MTRPIRFTHLHLRAVIVLLALSLVVSANPATHVFAEVMATPVVEAPVPAVANPDVETSDGELESVGTPTPPAEVVSIPTEAPVDLDQPTTPESTPEETAPVEIDDLDVVDVTPVLVETPAPQVPQPEATETEVPLAEMPVVIETPVPVVENPEVVEASTPELATPTPKVETSKTAETPAPRMVAPMAVTPGSSMSGCQQSSEMISPGEVITASCIYSLTVLPFSTVNGRVERPQLPVGYTASISTSPGGTGGFDNGPGSVDISFPRANLLGQTQVRIYITIAASKVTVPTQSFNSTFNTCMLNTFNSCALIGGQNSSMRVTIAFDSRQLTEGQQYAFDCSAPSESHISLGDVVHYDCTVKGLRGLGDRAMRLDYIDWTVTEGEGWQISLSGQTLVGTNERFVPGTATTISRNDPHPFAVTYTPTGCTASSQPKLTLKVHLTPVGQTTGGSTSAGVPLVASFAAPKSETHVELIAIPGTAHAEYSMTTDQSRTAQFTARYTVSGCKPWTGDAQMGPFKPASGKDVPSVPVLASATPGATRITEGSGSIVQPADMNILTAAPTKVITGTAPGGKVVVEQDINLRYTVPANTTVGTYESTVTVNIPAAP